MYLGASALSVDNGIIGRRREEERDPPPLCERMIKEGERDEEEVRGADEGLAERNCHHNRQLRTAIYPLSRSILPDCSRQEDAVIIPI